MGSGVSCEPEDALVPAREADRGGAPGGWRAVFVFLALYTIASLDRQVITLLVDPIRADLGISDFQISLLQGAAFVVFFALFGLPIGWAVDRFPRRPIIFVGVLIWSLGTIAGGFARSFGQLFVARSTVGAGEASLSPAAYSMLSDLFPKERLSTAMAVYSTGVSLGAALALVIGGFVVSLLSASGNYRLPVLGTVSSWQMVFLIIGAPGLVVAALAFAFPEPARRGVLMHSRRPSIADLFAFCRQRAGFYVAHIAGFSLFCVMSAGFVNWIPTLLMRRFSVPVSEIGLTLGAINLVCGSTGMIVSGLIVDRLFRRGLKDAHLRYYVFTVLIAGVAGVVTGLAPTYTIALIGMMVVKLIIPFIGVAAAALQITTPNEYRGQVSAIFLLIYNVVGYGFGPAIMAAISDFALGGARLDLALAITFAIFAPLTALTFALGLGHMRRAVKAADAWDENALADGR